MIEGSSLFQIPNQAFMFSNGFTYASFLLSESLEQVTKDPVPRALT